jgi:hypothetical protein
MNQQQLQWLVNQHEAQLTFPLMHQQMHRLLRNRSPPWCLQDRQFKHSVGDLGGLEGFGVGCLVGLSVTGAKVGGADGFEVEPVVVSSVIIGKETEINVGSFVIIRDLSDSVIVGWAVGSLETGEVIGK